MDFRPDETQQSIIDLAREILSGEQGEPWAALGQAGLLTLAVPERLGGAGLGMLETALVLTEIGRRALDVPALAHLAIGVPTVARWGDERQQDELLTGLILGSAIAEPGDPFPAAPRTELAADGTVTGVKTGVTTGDRILVTVAGPGVVVIDPAAPGAALHETGVLRLDRVAAEPFGHRGRKAESHADLHRNAIAGACALGDGALAGALELTADHVRTREQFGRPIATFQAVAQQIADVYVTARTLHLATLNAAWRLGTGRDADEDLDVAAQWFTGEAPAAARTCHHLHGGLGLSIDYPLHRHTALIRDLVRFLGGGEYRLEILGERLCTSN
ncbi:acyl-CoA dehydrogenase family protein [Actinoplanes couchii]|uniref:Acyl-CoA dehydrogenase n=1 Tax=Actinoplanes couchii TaxID=403638 RepID=A0ABQ3XF61_9ACTN|nr:acyl-CoA dehydrogenase family protein [Actinoplanes couchii]MDR6321924.1 alkylation response protein AidB-like acyl-CoA dehydrogenase [Actinoplanes couchii]GID57121.1 acyl-CoA dehydrogenase [Actinoplanes couchii]